MTTSTDAELHARVRQQEVIADLGQRALETADLDQLMRDAAVAVAETLDTEYCEVLELSPGGEEGLLRQGTGWRDGVVGDATVSTDRESQAGYTLLREEPVIVDDLRTEERFSAPELLTSHDVVSGISAIIGSIEDPWGVLGAHTTRRREFTEHDATFVKSVANILASAVANERTQSELRQRERQLSALIDNVPGVVYRCRNEHGWPMTFVSDACRDLTGYGPEALERGEVSWGEDVILTDQDRERLWETVQTEAGEGGTFSVTYRIETATGEVRWVRDYGRGVSDECGELVEIEGIISDVTERKRLETELEEIFSRVSDAFFALDEEWRFTHLNERAHELINPEGRSLEGKHVWEEFPAAVEREFKPKYERAMREQETVSFEEYYPDPLDAWFEVRAYPSETGLSVFFRDVTDRKEREQDLERYEAIVEAVNDGVYVVDDDWRFAMVNDAYAEMLGYDREELIGEHVSLVVDDDVIEQARQTELSIRDGSADAPVVQAEMKRADGERIPAEAAFAMLPKSGGAERRVGIVRDISDRKRRERELQQKERRYEAIFQDPNILVGLLEPDGTVLDINQTAMEYIDADLAAVTGEPFWETPWWGEGDGIQSEVREWTERAANGEYVDFETDLTRPDGERYTLSGYFRPVTDDDGEVVSIIVSDRDITERKKRERELVESERRYRTLVENFPDGSVGLFDENYTYNVVGGELLDELGLSPDDIVDTTIYSRYSDDLIEEIKPNFQAVFDGESNTFEIDLDERDLLAHTLPVRNADGEIYAGMLLVQDITERRERERELERALDLLNKTERIADVAGWEVDPETEEPYWSDHLFDILDVDYDEQPSLDQALDVYYAEEDRVIVEDAVEEALETGDSFDVEARFPRPAGDVGWLRIKGDAEVEDGAVVSLRGAVQDVTEHKEREQALQESRNQLRALIDVLPVAVFVAEADGEIVEWNEAAEEIWGGEIVESESVAEYDQYEAWWADTGEPVDPEEWPLARALRGETVTDSDEIRIKRFDGEYRTVLNHGMPVRDADGEVSRAVVTLVDITDRKEYERKLEESNERLEQFAYAASHDLQEPLRMVSSYLQLIERRYGDDLDEDGREFIEFAVDGADRMRDMIEGLLKYSRVDTRGDPFEPVDLDEVLEDVREDLQVKIVESDAEIAAEALPRVEGDASQLRQVFQNLLDNAIEYSGDDLPKVYVSSERNGDRWTISVRDEGIGIDSADADRAFEVFQSLHASEEHGGTGIGLALCERIVERHGGDIWIASAPGDGATVSFTLPVVGGTDE